MKLQMRLLALSLLALLFVTACSKDDNPTDNNLFVGTYTGETGYVSTASSVTYGAGKVTVVKVGDKYRFDFRDHGDIPDISEVTMSSGDGGFIGTVNGYTGTISIDNDHLSIHLIKDDQKWDAECDR